MEMIAFEDIDDARELELKTMIKNHATHTNSERAKKILDNWNISLNDFVLIMPSDYKKALERITAERLMNKQLTTD